MLDIEIRKRIVKILELALEKNGNTKIWVDYAGHVDFLTVRVIENYDNSIDQEYAIYKRFIDLDNKRYHKFNIEELDEVIKMLESIETKKVDIINNIDQIIKSSV